VPEPRTLPHGEWQFADQRRLSSPSQASHSGFVDSLGDEVMVGETRPSRGRAESHRRTAQGRRHRRGRAARAVANGPHARVPRVRSAKAWLPLAGRRRRRAVAGVRELGRPAALHPEPGTSAPRCPDSRADRAGALPMPTRPVRDGREFHCIREQHVDGGSPAHRVVPLRRHRVGGRDRGAGGWPGQRLPRAPAHLPDDRRITWLAWDQPADAVGGHQSCGSPTSRAGRRDECADPARRAPRSRCCSRSGPTTRRLYAVSDRTGWWNLYRLGVGEPGNDEATSS
jgi:hypothetical protein